MSILCKLGHKWEGCRCKRCGQTKPHTFGEAGKDCKATCQVCGRQEIQHDWQGCTCDRCGEKRNMEHDLQRVSPEGELYVCAKCGRAEYKISLFNTPTHAAQRVVEYQGQILERLKGFKPQLAGTPAAMEGSRLCVTLKAVMRITIMEERGSFDRFIEVERNGKQYGIHNDLDQLLNIGGNGLWFVLAAFGTEEDIQRNLDDPGAPDNAKGVMMEVMRAWYEARKADLPATERGFFAV